MSFLKRIFNFKKRKRNTNEQPNVPIVELSFTKEDVYKEFDAILKENPYKMDEECLKRIEGIKILDMHMRADSETINMHYREKYNNNIYEHELTASFETAEKWARYFYGDILQNYDPQENDPEVNELIKKAGKEAKRNLIFKRKTLGYCHTFWNEQKRILKDRYGIDWKTPADRNPDIRYD